MHLFHAAVVGQVHRLRAIAQHALDRGLHRFRVELHRRRGREDEGPLRAVQLAVGNAEGIAGEPAAAACIPHAVMVQCVARGVQQHQLAAGQVDTVAVLGHHHTMFGNGLDTTIAARDFLGTVHRRGTGNQPGRVDHVRRTARVQHCLCVGQLLHQQAGAAGVVQVHVREQQPVHRVNGQTRVGQRLQHRRHRQAGATVDERGAVVFNDQIGRVEVGTLEAGIDGVDAGVGDHRHAPGRIGNRRPW